MKFPAQVLTFVFLHLEHALGQFGRAQALDVPGVEVLVADQAQQGVIALAGLGLTFARQIAAAADQCRAVAVLEAAIVVIHHIEHEDIAIHGQLAAVGMPEGDLGLADLLRIGQ